MHPNTWESYETYLLLFELTVFTLKPTKLFEDIVVRKTILYKTDKKVKWQMVVANSIQNLKTGKSFGK